MDGADLPELELPAFPALCSEVQRCGWSDAPLDAGDLRARFRTFQGSHEASCRRFGNEHGQFLLAIDLGEVLLPGDDELFPRFLDLALVQRMALTLARGAAGVDWVLLATQRRIDLLRVSDEANEFRIALRAELDAELLPALTALARGRMRGGASIGHAPGAESLGGWIRHWSLQLAAALDEPSERVGRIIWKWILMLQAARRLDGIEGVERAPADWGLQCQLDEGVWNVSYDAVSATDDLCRALEDFDELFVTRELPPEEGALAERLAKLEETTLLDQLRAELLMHSQGRFEAETAAWLFTSVAREQAGWRREVQGIEPVRKRMQVSGWTVYQPLTLDAGQYGVTAALAETERLAEFLNEQNLFERNRQAESRGSARQPDLFCPNPRGIGPGGQLDDGLNYMFAEALRLTGVERAGHFGIIVTLLLKGIALAPKMGWPFLGIDTIDKVFEEKNAGPA